MKRNPPVKRDWSAARAKVEDEGACRGCGKSAFAVRIEAAHILGRSHDEEYLHEACNGEGCRDCNQHGRVMWVNPDDVVPLCGPATTTSTCHGQHHNHDLDLLPLLRPSEGIRAVTVLEGNITAAYVGLAGISRTPEEVAASLPPQRVAPLDPGVPGFQLYPATPLSPPPGSEE